MRRVVRRELALDPGEAIRRDVLRARVQRRERADHAGLALRDHQIGHRDDEQRRTDHRDGESPSDERHARILRTPSADILRRLEHHEAEPHAERNGFGAARRAELGQDRGDVRFDGVLAEREAARRYAEFDKPPAGTSLALARSALRARAEPGNAVAAGARARSRGEPVEHDQAGGDRIRRGEQLSALRSGAPTPPPRRTTAASGELGVRIVDQQDRRNGETFGDRCQRLTGRPESRDRIGGFGRNQLDAIAEQARESLARRVAGVDRDPRAVRQRVAPRISRRTGTAIANAAAQDVERGRGPAAPRRAPARRRRRSVRLFAASPRPEARVRRVQCASVAQPHRRGWTPSSDGSQPAHRRNAGRRRRGPRARARRRPCC